MVYAVAIVAMSIAFAVLVGCQTLVLPRWATDMASSYPEYADLRIPGIVLAGVLLACAEVALVALWRVLSLARRTAWRAARRWLNVICASAIVGAGVIAVGLCVIGSAQAGSPATLLLGLIGMVGCAATAVVVGIGRSVAADALKEADA